MSNWPSIAWLSSITYSRVKCSAPRGGAELLLVHVKGGAYVVPSKFSCVEQTDLLYGRTVAVALQVVPNGYF